MRSPGVKCFISWPSAVQERRIAGPLRREIPCFTLIHHRGKPDLTEAASHRSVHERHESIRWDDDSPLTMNVETRSGIDPDTTRSIRGWGCRSGRSNRSRHRGGACHDAAHARHVDLVPGGGRHSIRLAIRPSPAPSIRRSSPCLIPAEWAGWKASTNWWSAADWKAMVRPNTMAKAGCCIRCTARIGNLPADSLSIEYDEASGTVGGDRRSLRSRKLFFKNLRLRSRVRFHAGSANVELLDDVTNDSVQARQRCSCCITSMSVRRVLGAGARPGSTDRRAGSQRHAVGGRD